MFTCILDEVGSTNSYAKDIIQQELCNESFAVLAHSQVAGVGKLGVKWISFVGNLHLSVCLKQDDKFSLKNLGILSLLSSLAVRNTIEKYVPSTSVVSSKWPNDILVDGAKISGILLELENNNYSHYMIVGIGVNLLRAPEIESYKTISLKTIIGQEVNNISFAQEVINEIYDLLDYVTSDKSYIINQWKEKAYLFKHEISVKVQGSIVKGIFADLTDEGYLVLNTRNNTLVIPSGEVITNKITNVL